MTDASAQSTTVEILPPTALIALDLWDAAQPGHWLAAEAPGFSLPGPGQSAELGGEWRAIRIEPTVWWLSGPLEDLSPQLERLEAALGELGAVADISGAFARLAVAGPGWRAILMIDGVFDAENQAFGPGSNAGTVLHHVGVRHDVIAEDLVHIHVAPSYGEHLLAHLTAVAARLEANGERER